VYFLNTLREEILAGKNFGDLAVLVKIGQIYVSGIRQILQFFLIHPGN